MKVSSGLFRFLMMPLCVAPEATSDLHSRTQQSEIAACPGVNFIWYTAPLCDYLFLQLQTYLTQEAGWVSHLIVSDVTPVLMRRAKRNHAKCPQDLMTIDKAHTCRTWLVLWLNNGMEVNQVTPMIYITINSSELKGTLIWKRTLQTLRIQSRCKIIIPSTSQGSCLDRAQLRKKMKVRLLTFLRSRGTNPLP